MLFPVLLEKVDFTVSFTCSSKLFFRAQEDYLAPQTKDCMRHMSGLVKKKKKGKLLTRKEDTHSHGIPFFDFMDRLHVTKTGFKFNVTSSHPFKLHSFLLHHLVANALALHGFH